MYLNKLKLNRAKVEAGTDASEEKVTELYLAMGGKLEGEVVEEVSPEKTEDKPKKKKK